MVIFNDKGENDMEMLQDIKKTITFEAPIQKVWNQVSTAKGIESWFMPNDFEPIVGHEFHIQSPFGPSPCKVLEVNEPNKITFSWDTEGWFVSFSLKDLGDNKTEFTLIHGGWKVDEAVISKANEKSSVIRDRMDNGWTGIVHNLKKAVEG